MVISRNVLNKDTKLVDGAVCDAVAVVAYFHTRRPPHERGEIRIMRIHNALILEATLHRQSWDERPHCDISLPMILLAEVHHII